MDHCSQSLVRFLDALVSCTFETTMGQVSPRGINMHACRLQENANVIFLVKLVSSPSYQSPTREGNRQVSQTLEKSSTLETPEKPVHVYSIRKEKDRPFSYTGTSLGGSPCFGPSSAG